MGKPTSTVVNHKAKTEPAELSTMKSAARLTELIIKELHRQAATSGCTTEDNGKLVQVDGSFDAERLAIAILEKLHDGD